MNGLSQVVADAFLLQNFIVTQAGGDVLRHGGQPVEERPLVLAADRIVDYLMALQRSYRTVVAGERDEAR